jgi:hypothetical protein
MDMVRIGPLHVALAGGIALLLVGVGGVVADTPAVEQPGIDGADVLIQDEANDSQQQSAIVAPTPDDDPYEVGETVPIELSLNDTDIATVTVGSVEDPQNARFTATVRDNGTSGNVTVEFDPDGFGGENDGFSVGENVALVNTTSEYDEEAVEDELNAVTYNITLAEGDQPHYEESVNSTDSISVKLIDPEVTFDAPTSGELYEVGDELTMALSFQDADVGTVSITYTGGSATFTATVSDDDGDGAANVTFDPAAVVDEGNGFSAGDGATLEDTSADTGDSVSNPSLYDLVVAPSADAPGTADVTATDSVELVVSGDDESGDESGDENSDENGDENSDENGDENSDENGDESGDENGDENSDENGDESGDENGDESSDENGDENGDENSNENGDENNDGDTSDDNGAGFGILAVVGAVVATALLARKRTDG